MNTEIGIQETKELLEFGFALQEAISKSLSDDKITILDAPKFLGVVRTAGPAFGNIQRVAAEISNLSPQEKTELLDFVREKFDLPDDQLEILIEDTLDEILSIYKLATRWATKRK